MKPTENIENTLRETSCTASDAMRRRLWQDIAERRHEAKAKAQSHENPHVWRFLLRSRTARLTAAAVVFLGALAVGVETFRPHKSSQPHAFSAEIRADTALDLDPKAAIPLRQAQPGDFDVTWDGENGGTLRIMPGSSLRLSTPSWTQPQWDDVVDWAHARLAEIGESAATSVSARQSRFAAILTSEGNLAVVQIGDYDESKARLQWQVENAILPGYGPVQVVTLACVEPNHPSAQACAIDFDTERTIAIRAQGLGLAPEGFLAWLEQNGIDALAKVSDEGGCLAGVGLFTQTWEAGLWARMPAPAVRDAVTRISYQSRDPILYREGQYQRVHPFRTREGGIGILQMRGVDRARQTVEFRYRMVLEDAPAGTEGEGQADAESLQLARSGEWMNRLGRSLLIYGSENEDRLPQSLEEMSKYADSEEQYQWLVANVEYVGAGLLFSRSSPSLVLAYDKTLLAQGKGTHVLFLDTHIDFVEPEEFAEYNLSGGVEAVRQKNAERDQLDRSREYLDQFGQSLRIYGNYNQNRLPPSLEEVRQYVGRENWYQWIVTNVEYCGAGLLFSQSPSLVVAYDKTLLTEGEGTNVLFLDGHSEFVEPERLAALGLPAGPPGASATPEK